VIASNKTIERNIMSIDTPPVTPQQYEVLHGGGAEAAEIAKERLSRRRFLRRSVLAIWGLSTTASIGGALSMLYPNLTGLFGGSLNVGKKSAFNAARPHDFRVNQAGVFYHQQAKTYMVHLAKETHFLLHGTDLSDQFASETILKDDDGSYWIALYQRCVHLGCTVPFRDDCLSFKCPCHGSHYNSDGEYLDGPAPRSLDRFAFHFEGEDVLVDTGTLNNRVPHPDVTTRLIPVPPVQCSI
jgi:cytochrome b6-f complex iron-sulfur subunit